MTFSHSDFYKVNEIVFKPFLFDISNFYILGVIFMFNFTKVVHVWHLKFSERL